jgi:hypothetical protein
VKPARDFSTMAKAAAAGVAGGGATAVRASVMPETQHVADDDRGAARLHGPPDEIRRL